MESLIFSLNVSLPIVLTMVAGYFLGKKNVITPEFDAAASRLVFDYAYPCSLFCGILSSSIKELLNVKLLAFAVLSQVGVFLVILLITPRIVKDRAKAASMIQGMIRVNVLLQGVPVAINMYGTQGAAPAFIILPFSISVNTIVSQITFTTLLPESKGTSPAGTAGRIILQTIKSPLVITAVVGIIAAYLPFKLPTAIMGVFETIGKIAGPLALLILGARFEPGSLKNNLRYTLPSSFVRVAAMPFLVTVCAIALGFRGSVLGCLFAMCSSSTASISYITAKTLGGDAEIAAQIVGLTVAMSAFTMFAGIFFLRFTGFI